MGLLLGGDEQGPSLRGERAEQRRLAAGPRTAVQPAPVGSVQGRVGEGERDELAALVLHARAPVPHGRDGARLPALGQPHGIGRPAPLYGGVLVEQFLRGGPPGPRHQGHLGPFVVGTEQLLDAVPAAAEGVPQRGHDPPRVRVDDGEMVLGILVVGRCDPLQPAVEIVLRDLAQHGVDELGPPVAEHHPRQLDGGGDGRVRRDPRAEQLMRAEAQHVQHRRVDLPERPVHTGRQDRVVRPLPPQRPVDQLGGERRVPGVEVVFLACLAQQGRQHEVGVGVPLVHGPQRLEGEDADGVLLGPAVGLA